MPPPTKPNPPSGFAQRAKILVGIGKARMASTIPAGLQALPTITIRPDQTKHTILVGQYKWVNNYTYMKPIDYIGLYIIVIASCIVATNWLYRIYF